MLDLAMPDAHRSWCEDRDKPRSQDHQSQMGDPHCTAGISLPDGTFLTVVEEPGSPDGIAVAVDGGRFVSMHEAARQAASIDGAIAALEAVLA